MAAKKGNDYAQVQRFYQDTPTDIKRLENNIDAYFQKIIDDPKITPTISGFALHLGFADRHSIYDYISKDYKCSNIIKKAVTKIEVYWESRLAGNNPTGSIFWLKNRGWADKQEVESSGQVNINIVKTLINERND